MFQKWIQKVAKYAYLVKFDGIALSFAKIYAHSLKNDKSSYMYVFLRKHVELERRWKMAVPIWKQNRGAGPPRRGDAPQRAAGRGVDLLGRPSAVGPGQADRSTKLCQNVGKCRHVFGCVDNFVRKFCFAALFNIHNIISWSTSTWILKKLF